MDENIVLKAVEKFGPVKLIKLDSRSDGITARITFDSQAARDLCLSKGKIQLTQ